MSKVKNENKGLDHYMSFFSFLMHIFILSLNFLNLSVITNSASMLMYNGMTILLLIEMINLMVRIVDNKIKQFIIFIIMMGLQFVSSILYINIHSFGTYLMIMGSITILYATCSVLFQKTENQTEKNENITYKDRLGGRL